MNPSVELLSNRMSRGETERLAAIADNLANGSTPGYKRVLVVTRPFDKAVDAAQLEAGTTHAVDFTQGPLTPTGRPLDFALKGNGFFVVEHNGTPLYTRNGQFTVTADGALTTLDGLPVQGEDGDISIPDKITASDITVENDGTLRAGNTTIGRLRLASFANPKDLVRVGPSRFSAPATAVPAEAEDTEVANGMLEGANSSVFEEMSEMIVAMRSFEACQKMLKARDRADELTIEKLAV